MMTGMWSSHHIRNLLIFPEVRFDHHQGESLANTETTPILDYPLGYWNTQFHHGNYLQSSISRPEVARFDARGGAAVTWHPGLESKR
jgi:hypothetical protein